MSRSIGKTWTVLKMYVFYVEEHVERKQLPTEDADEDDPSRLTESQLTSLGNKKENMYIYESQHVM